MPEQSLSSKYFLSYTTAFPNSRHPPLKAMTAFMQYSSFAHKLNLNLWMEEINWTESSHLRIVLVLWTSLRESEVPGLWLSLVSSVCTGNQRFGLESIHYSENSLTWHTPNPSGLTWLQITWNKSFLTVPDGNCVQWFVHQMFEGTKQAC